MKFAFMGGLPRSGSSLLTALLNQRDDVYASELNYSADIVRYLDIAISTDERFLSGTTSQRDNLLKNLFQSMYADKDVDLVIDKSRAWGTPYHRKKLIEIFGNDIKIICPVRPLKEIVASFIVLAQNNKNNFIDAGMLEDDMYSLWTKPINDARTDWLLKYDGHICLSILSLSGAFSKELSHMYHLVEYKDLCLNTISTMRNLEKFLEIPEFEYNLFEINGEKAKDLETYGIEKMHEVKKTIEYSNIDYRKILSNYAISRCDLEDFWTK